MRIYLRPARPRRPSTAGERHFAALRAAPMVMSGPVDPAFDPCGAPPLEAARRRAVATLIATMGRYAR